MIKLALLGTYGLQIIFSSAVLGLSITLAKGQLIGSVPTITSYSAFLGGLGMVSGAFGIVTLFFHVFGTLIPLVMEGLVMLLFLAGGIIMAISIKGGKCSDFTYVAGNKITNCGGTNDLIAGQIWYHGVCTTDQYPKGQTAPKDWTVSALKVLEQRCEEATADYGLMFAIVLLSAVAVGLGYVWRRNVK